MHLWASRRRHGFEAELSKGSTPEGLGMALDYSGFEWWVEFRDSDPSSRKDRPA